MTGRAIVRRGAGLVACLSFALIWQFYGRAWLLSLSLPIPVLGLPSSGGALADIRLPDGHAAWALSIPKIDVRAPVIPQVSWSDATRYDRALENGVALADGSADVDAGWGNSFVFGHSSSLVPGPYDTVFAGLPRLQKDDRILFQKDGKEVAYKVVTSQSVAPDAVSYLASQPKKQLTLVTCYPAGTDKERWLVQAERVE